MYVYLPIADDQGNDKDDENGYRIDFVESVW